MLMKPGATNSPLRSISSVAVPARRRSRRSAVPDRDVGLESRIAAAVEDGAVPDDRVERRASARGGCARDEQIEIRVVWSKQRYITPARD
jgi:hypothetical protein